MNMLRFRFVKGACDRLTEDADFAKKKIIFSDEAHFDLGGYVRQILFFFGKCFKKNYRIFFQISFFI